MFFDPLYLIFALPAICLSLFATLLVHLFFWIYSKQRNAKGLSGQQAGAMIAENYGLDVTFQNDGGNLTDNYNPGENIVTLSDKVNNQASIAAVAIAAHEMGHVIQYQKGSVLIKFRSILIPVVNFGTNLGYILIILGFLLAFTGLVWVGIIFFSLSTLFTLLTLPVEIDASRRGLAAIKKLRLLEGSEMSGAVLVLMAAALTYVAAVLASIMNLLYFIARARGMSRD